MKSTRKEAIEAQESYFFTGVPCKYGHISKRLTVNNNCYECIKIRSREYQAKGRAALKQLSGK